jgi:uncharacterized membrane protein YeaQ/YmgE (transglycosylase-associated protein family)
MDAGLGGWLGTIVIGGIAGWIASMVMKTDASMGLIANVVVGVVGALLANLVLPMFGIAGTTDGSSFVRQLAVAFVGAVLVLFVFKLVTGRRAV